MQPLDPGHPLRKLFSGLVEHVFQSELGICNPRLTDYVGDVLVDFVHVDEIYRVRDIDGAWIREFSRIEADAALGPEIAGSARTRLINRYIGDFTLFWAGVYPENLRPRHNAGVDRLLEFLLQGKRSYGIAGELSTPESLPSGEVLLQLSEEFEACVHGLRLVREGWERHPDLIDGN